MGLLNSETIEQGDFITSSSGPSDAGKAPKLDADGLIDESMVVATLSNATTGTAIARRLSRYHFVDLDNTNTEVVNTTTETTCYTMQIPVPMREDSGIRIRVAGGYGEDSTSVDGTNTLRIKLNGTTVASHTFNASTLEGRCLFRTDTLILNDGSLSSQKYRSDSIAGRNFTDEGGGSTNQKAQVDNNVITGTSSVSTGSSDTVTVTLQNSDAGTDDRSAVSSVIVEVIE